MELTKWMKRGRHKRAIVKALKYPLTPSQIWNHARQHAPRIRLQDLWHVLRQLERNQLVLCLSPKAPTCKVYALTEFGRAKAKEVFDLDVPSLPSGINWHSYSRIVKSKARKSVLQEMGRCRFAGEEKTAPKVRRTLLSTVPLKYNAVSRAMSEMAALKLLKLKGQNRRGQNIYEITTAGKNVLQLLTALPDVAPLAGQIHEQGNLSELAAQEINAYNPAASADVLYGFAIFLALFLGACPSLEAFFRTI